MQRKWEEEETPRLQERLLSLKEIPLHRITHLPLQPGLGAQVEGSCSMEQGQVLKALIF